MSGDELALRLRAATREPHHRLDHHALLAPLLRPTLNVADYACSLSALYAAQSTLEHLVCGFAPQSTFPPRAAQLRADLDDLGRAPQPLRATPPQASDDAQRIGLMYVLEGSLRGASLIARLLDASLPRQVPRRFYRDDQPPQRWPAFWTLAAARAQHADIAGIERSAVAALRFFAEHLDGCLGSASEPACA